MSYDDRLTNIENFLAKIAQYETPRIKSEKISEGDEDEHHVGKPSPEMIEQKVVSFLNSFEPTSLSKDEKKDVKKVIDEMLDHIEHDLEKSDLKTNLKQKLIQANEKLESKK